MNTQEHIAQLRKKVAYTKGLRNLAAKAELAESLIHTDSLEEAETVAVEAEAQARKLYARALERGAKDSEYRKALAKCVFAVGICRDYGMRFNEAEGALRESAELFESVKSWPAYVKSMRLLAGTLQAQKRTDAALEILDRSIEFCKHTRYDKGISALLTAKANTLFLSSGVEKARTCLEQAIDAAQDNKQDKAYALHAYAYSFFLQQDHKTADSYFKQAINLRDGVNPGFDSMSTHRMAAINLHAMGNSSGALEHLRTSIKIAQSHGFFWQEAELLHRMADIYRGFNSGSEAYEYYQKAHKVFIAIEDGSGASSCLAHMGAYCYENGDKETGRIYMRQCLAQIEVAGKTLKHLQAVSLLLKFCPEECDLDALRSLIEELIRLNIQKGPVAHLARQAALGEILLAQGASREAEQAFRKCLDLACKAGNLRLMTKLRLQLGKVSVQAGDLSGGIALFKEALAQGGDLKNTELLASIHAELASVLEAAGDTAPALKHLRRSVELKDELRRQQNLQRTELLKVEHDVAALEDQSVKQQQQIDSLTQEREADKRLIQVLNARTERDVELLTEVRTELRNTERKTGAAKLNSQPALRLIEERLLEIESTKDEAELVNIDHKFMSYLAEKYPQLTSKERRVCALIRTNISNNDIARLMGISQRSIETYRYRIRKKFGFEPGSDLNAAVAALTGDL